MGDLVEGPGTPSASPAEPVTLREIVVSVSGPLDAATARDFAGEALTGAGDSAVRLIIDLADLTVLDSSGLGALVTLHSSAIATGGVMQLRAVPQSAQRLIDRVGLGDVFDVG